MKMEHSVVAPRDGVVEQVLVVPGMQVAQGQVMVMVGKGEDPEAGGKAGEGKAGGDQKPGK